MSPKTVRNYYSIVYGIIQFGIRMRLIDQNPCRDIILPKKEQEEAAYYSKEEVAALLDALDKVPREELK